jgi:hypothetical protein
MADKQAASKILRQARALLKSGDMASLIVRKSGHIESPIPVLGSNREIHSWFVPVTVGDRLAAFFQFLPDLTMMRYSSFQRQEGSLDGCPPARDWIDDQAIKRRAKGKARPGEIAGKPFLTFDRFPSRLAWAVELALPRGATRKVFVAGEQIWECTADDDPESYGHS